MPALRNRTGERCGRLTVLRRTTPTPAGRIRWLCRCDCGRETAVSSANLTTHHVISCGCAQREASAAVGRRTIRFAQQARTKHGLATRNNPHPFYNTWMLMVRRCTSPKSPDWESYGGRGIRVCDRWRNDFAAFVADVGPRPSRRHSLDRIDNSGNYEPGNVRWATPHEQRINQRPRRRRSA